MTVIVRTSGDETALMAPLRRDVQQLDANLPIFAVRPLHEYVDTALAPTRFAMMLIGVFALLALTLAAVGL